MPRMANSSHTLPISASKNCASSMPTTSTSWASNNIFWELSTGVLLMKLVSWLTIFTSSYRVSIAGLKISTFKWAIFTRFSLRINSSVFPLNMLPQITSIQPRRSPLKFGSINIHLNFLKFYCNLACSLQRLLFCFTGQNKF